MSAIAQVSRAFNAAVIGALVAGLVCEIAHFLVHEPQPHTTQQEHVAHKMMRLREAELQRHYFSLVARTSGFVPPQPKPPAWAVV